MGSTSITSMLDRVIVCTVLSVLSQVQGDRHRTDSQPALHPDYQCKKHIRQSEEEKMFCRIESSCLQTQQNKTSTAARAEICQSIAHVKLLMITMRRLVLFSKYTNLADNLFPVPNVE